jgi:flagellar P-ring protein precursor FlgI
MATAMTRLLRRILAAAAAAGLGLALLAQPAAAARIKDLTDVSGVRGNQLIGYGLVVGLNGTGDSLRSNAFTERSLKSMLNRFGVGVTQERLRSRNVAAVMVTAKLPPFARKGSRIDVKVSAMGDAESLRGGTLLQTPLKAGNGKVYVVAQGPVSPGGFQAEGQAASVVRGVPTSGVVAGGGLVEREVDFTFNELKQVELALRDPDFTTATNIADAINAELDSRLARARDSGTIVAEVPSRYDERVARFVSKLENIRIDPDQPARVVIDADTGTVVIGGNVTVEPVAVSQGNIEIQITETPRVSQPPPLSPGETVQAPETDIQVEERGTKQIAKIDGTANLQQLVDGLNALGVGPRGLIPILRTIDAQGALNAELEVR